MCSSEAVPKAWCHVEMRAASGRTMLIVEAAELRC
jgi:hypothetical protein